jgi:hypothetical protein
MVFRPHGRCGAVNSPQGRCGAVHSLTRPVRRRATHPAGRSDAAQLTRRPGRRMDRITRLVAMPAAVARPPVMAAAAVLLAAAFAPTIQARSSRAYPAVGKKLCNWWLICFHGDKSPGSCTCAGRRRTQAGPTRVIETAAGAEARDTDVPAHCSSPASGSICLRSVTAAEEPGWRRS